MGNKFLAITLLAFYLLALVQPSAPMVAFFANQDYYAQNFCENKAKPALKCNGKCHLKKMMRQAPPDPVSEIDRPVTVPFALHLKHVQDMVFESVKHPPLYRFADNLSPLDYHPDVDHPPEVI